MDTEKLLKYLGYDFYKQVQEADRPEEESLTFSEVFPEISRTKRSYLAGERLYSHQLSTFKALKSGKNVILISGSGSGKTEAWFLYSKDGAKTMAVYPTLALANDQISRLKEYSEALGLKAEAMDSMRRKEMKRVSSADILITNPAFLMTDMKRWVSGGPKILYGFVERMDLLVLDEFDFYDPRCIALIISMIKLLRLLSPKNFSIAILTATLGNPEEMARILTQINGRETEVIRGRPFRPENRVYVVVGKDLKYAWERVRSHKEEISRVAGRDIAESIDDFDKFKMKYYSIREIARYLGIELPEAYVDPVEVITRYAEDDGATIVFTRSIRSAEELYRRILSEHPEISHRVATHHHLVDKEKRAEIERLAKEGVVKILISPRTLAQGIDIGEVIRIVHIGLPPSVREFKQREGRKGRRRWIKYTETVIFPMGSWDRELLLRGVDVLEKWSNMKLEIALVNPENKYSTLFEAMYKFMSSALRAEMSQKELDLLKNLDLVKGTNLTSSGKRAWRNLNFYEFAPPYGIKRVLVGEDSISFLSDIGYCDLVERFQVGCIDHSSDGIVKSLRRRGRYVTGVELVPITDIRRVEEELSYTLEEYEKTKLSWGEHPDVLGDYRRGRLHSEVICVVDPPVSGFGFYRKIPNRAYWVLNGPLRPIVAGDKTYFIRDRRSLEIVAETGGRYSDYTYGYSIELDPAENITWLRIGLALLCVVLRQVFGIDLSSLEYSIVNTGSKKLMSIHEPRCAGLLDTMDWQKVRDSIQNFKPDEISEIMLMQVDDQAHLEFISSGANWDLARRYAIRAVDYIMAERRIPMEVSGIKASIPAPSRALRLLSVETSLVEFEDVKILYISLFDGEKVLSGRFVRELVELVESNDDVMREMQRSLDSGFILVTYDLDSVLEDIRPVSTGLYYMMFGLRGSGKVEELRERVRRIFGDPTPQDILRVVGNEKVHLKDLMSEIGSSDRILKMKGSGRWRNFTNFLDEKARKYLQDRVISVYKLHLFMRELEKSKGENLMKTEPAGLA
ncbi:MAG: DEAD/DEAH box helicase [Candidatus Methanodesulfokora sp.]